MRIVLLFFCFTGVVSWAAAADEPRTVTIAVSRSAVLVPDQALFSVSVLAPADATLDQAVSAVQSFGITSQSLTGVQSASGNSLPGSPAIGLQYTFSLAVPVTQFLTTINSLQAATAASQSSSTVSSRQLSFQLQSLQVSDARISQARLPAMSDLFTEAKQRALTLAQLSGRALGPLRSVRDTSYSNGGAPAYGVPTIFDPSAISFVATAQQIQFGLLVTYDLAQ